MALDRNAKYPGRFDNPTTQQPQGAFKNRTTDTSKDGSYLEKDWLNDFAAFFSSLLDKTGTSVNNVVDGVGASQYFDSLETMIGPDAIVLDDSGYVKMPTGMIIQWGHKESPVPECLISPTTNVDHVHPTFNENVVFPIPFPNAVFSLTVTPVSTISAGQTEGGEHTAGVFDRSLSGFDYALTRIGGTTSGTPATISMNYIAIGR